MKHIGKLLIIAGCLVFAGVICMFAGMGILWRHGTKAVYINANGNGNRDNYVSQEYRTEVDGIEVLETDLGSDDVTIQYAEGNQFVIQYTDDAQNPTYSITNENGKLKIRHQENFSLLSGQWVIDLFGDDKNSIDYGEVVIRVPKEYAGAYDIGFSSGSVTMEDMSVAEGVAVDMSSGSLNFSDISCQKGIQVVMTSGSVDFLNVSCEEDLQMDMTSGSLNFTNVTTKGELKLDASSGNMDVNKASASKLLIDITSGDVDIEELTVEQGVSVEVTSGNVEMELTDKKENYTIYADVLSGDCNLPEVYENGAKEISVSVTSGMVDVIFAEE